MSTPEPAFIIEMITAPIKLSTQKNKLVKTLMIE